MKPKSITILQPKTWTPSDGADAIIETRHDDLEAGFAYWNASDRDENWVSVWECNEIYFDRKCVASNRYGIEPLPDPE